MNTIKCKECRHYDQQYKYKAGKRLPVWYGYCKKTSVYPTKETEPGTQYDADVVRADEGQAPRIDAVAGTDVKHECIYATRA